MIGQFNWTFSLNNLFYVNNICKFKVYIPSSLIVAMSWVSFWLPRASKMHATSEQADIGNTYENLRFLLIFEGWRLANAVSGSLWKLGGALGLAVGFLDGSWLAG